LRVACMRLLDRRLKLTFDLRDLFIYALRPEPNSL
jgi:hypothetical protein